MIMSKKVIQNISRIILLVVWTIGAFLAVSYTVGLLLSFFASDALLTWLNTPVGTLTIGAVVYMLSFVLVLAPLKFSKLSKSEVAEQLGLRQSSKKWAIPWVLLTWLIYMFFSVVAMMVLYSLNLSGIDLQERQNVGFNELSSSVDYILAFITLVVLAPVFEEAMFRGFLFGQLRKRHGFWVSAIVTSLAFAVVHFQFNVGVDVFILSLFLCYLRERFQSIWPSIMLHALKNGIAYTLLFILPLLGFNLIQ